MTLHMVQLAPDMPRLMRWAASETLLPGKGEADLGYVLHAALAAAFGPLAPKPFVLETGRGGARVLGYGGADAEALRAQAGACALPEIHAMLGIESVASKPMPARLPAGARFGFTVRVRPTMRVDRDGDRARTAERDVFPPDGADRGRHYAAWLQARLSAAGAEVLQVTLDSYRGLAVCRRDRSRRLRVVDGPDATLNGVLSVADPDSFAVLLARGVGRHRAFGFGMLLLRPAQG